MIYARLPLVTRRFATGELSYAKVRALTRIVTPQSEEQLMEVTLDAGAEDIKNEGDVFLVTCPVDSFMAVGEALTAAGIDAESKQITRIPTNTVDVTDPEVAKNVLRLVELLDDHDDVHRVYAAMR